MYAPAISPHDARVMMLNCDMSGAYITRDGGRSWRMIHHAQLRANTRCRPAFHPVEPDTIFAAAGWRGRLEVSRDGGVTWGGIGNLPGGLRGAIAIDPDRPELMLIGVEESVWRSDDGGKTWARCTGVEGEAVGFHFDRTGPAAARVCFAATKRGVWRSDDGGTTWRDSSAGLPGRDVLAFSGGSSAREKSCILYCSVSSRVEGGRLLGGIWRSTDRGETWETAMGEGINRDTAAADQWAMGPVAQYPWVLATDVRPGTVYALNSNTGVKPPHHATVFRSDDAGRTWRATFTPDPRFGGMNVDYNWQVAGIGQHYQEAPSGAAVAPSDPEVVFHCGSMLAYATADGGKTWYPAHTRPAPGADAKREDARWLCNGLVVTTTWNYYVDPHQRQRHYIAYTDIGFARSLDTGASWLWWGGRSRAPWQNTCYELAFDPETPGRVWGAFSNVHDIPNDNVISGRHRSTGGGGVCLSEDFAATWAKSSTGLPEAAVVSVTVDPKSPRLRRTLWAAVWEQGVYRSDDDGRTWVRKSAGLGAPGRNMRAIRVALHPDGTLFALVTAKREGRAFLSAGAGLYRSTDRGENWEAITREGQFLWPKDFTTDPGDSRIVYLGAADAGRDREQGGLYRTADGGKSWELLVRKGPEHFGAFLRPGHPGWIYATLCEGAPDAGLWLSRDGGKTWQAFDRLPFSNVQRVTFDPTDESAIYVTTFGGSVWRGPVEPG
jgi:photosystem II stability/assembly factor-like uncharacterized protein